MINLSARRYVSQRQSVSLAWSLTEVQKVPMFNPQWTRMDWPVVFVQVLDYEITFVQSLCHQITYGIS